VPEPEIEKIFSRSTLLVLPYLSSTQSGVIPIAASLGLPVIATQTGGLSEQIEDGVSGWLVPPGNQEALANAIKEALDHPTLAQERGLALRNRYETMFSWDTIGQMLAESLKSASQARGKA
jgi:glycosyltransferase involved in cell wall biosynthesis